MRNGLQARQEQMRQRQLGYVCPIAVLHPVNYSRRVAYSSALTPIFPDYSPEGLSHGS
jgi:hypothetical protein